MKRLIGMLVACVLLVVCIAPCAASASVNEALLSCVGGDVNGDFNVTTSDVRALFATLSGDRVMPASAALDANNDGLVNMMDALFALGVTVGSTKSIIHKPEAAEVDTAPEGDEVAYVLGNNDRQYADDRRREERVWIVQSYEELQAAYAHSGSYKDFTEKYTPAYFEENALIIWDSHIREYGLTNVRMDRIVHDGNALCLVRNVRIFLNMPVDWFDRYLLEISKDALVGVDTIYTATEYTYVE